MFKVIKFHEVFLNKGNVAFLSWSRDKVVKILRLILIVRGIFGQRCYNNKRIKIKFK